jgi:uncharacterized membrane protein
MRGLWRRLEPVALVRIAVGRWTEAAVFAAAAVACLLFSTNAVDRHRAFESNAYDFGFFDQIIWNTSQGRWFQSSFTPYNFLGQHFQPVLLVFALAYRLGAGIELLLVTQTFFVGAAAVPLFYAVRRATKSGIAALAMSLGFLFSASLHSALDFDFHPELMGFFFVFLALYYLVSGRPIATIVSLLPLLLLKEDMPLVLGAFAVLLFARGFRRAGLVLFGIGAVYAMAVVVVLMPLIRGGPGDLTQRYGYLVADSTWWSVVPNVISRALQQLWTAPLAAALRLTGSTGFIVPLSPVALLAAAPSYLLAALSDHQAQSRLELHYVTAPLALAWVGTVLGVERLARGTWPPRGSRPRNRSVIAAMAATFVLTCSIGTFLLWSPYSPRAEHHAPDAAHRALLKEALALVPAGAPVSGQNTLLPHLSRRRDVFEFPNLRDADYVIIDPSLPVTNQARQAGYDTAVASLPDRGFDLIFDRDGVKVFRRTR